jgi:hypothetical protein
MSKKSKIIRLNALREKRVKEEKVSTSIRCKESGACTQSHEWQIMDNTTGALQSQRFLVHKECMKNMMVCGCGEKRYM